MSLRHECDAHSCCNMNRSKPVSPLRHACGVGATKTPVITTPEHVIKARGPCGMKAAVSCFETCVML
eukprot:12412191-Karenia_brevis.AAC.1